MKNSMCKIFSVIMALVMMLVAVPVLVSANELPEPVFTVDKVSENENELQLSVGINTESVVCFDIKLTVKDLTCKSIVTTEAYDAFAKSLQFEDEQESACSQNAATGKFSVSSTKSLTAPMIVAIYTFEKSEKHGVNGSDITLEISSCYVKYNEDDADVTSSATYVNSLPATHVHTPAEEWVTTQEAKCDTVGTRVHYCTECGCVAESEDIQMTEHKNTHQDYKAPTCTVAGYDDTYCDDCHQRIKHTVLEPTNHPNTTIDRHEATCTEDGYVKVICKDCEEVISTEVLTATGHQHTRTVTVNAECEKDGYTQVICDDCKQVIKTTVIPATGHQHIETVTVNPECEKDGYTRQVCKDCKKIISETVLPAKGHTTKTEVKESTCTEAGYIRIYCPDCEKIFSETPIAPAHKWSDWIRVKEPTTRTFGVDRRYCLACGAFEDKEIPIIKTPVTGVKISMTSLSIFYKQTSKLYADVMPEEAAFSSSIVWTSSNPKVIAVDEDGNITAKGVGTATVTATSDDGKFSDSCTVTVKYSWIQKIIVYVLFGWIWYLD